MNDRIKAFANAMGADIIAELPDVGHGALGAAHYAGYYRKRMDEITRQTDERVSNLRALSVSVDEPTIHALESISEILWPGEHVEAPQLASGFLKGMAVLMLDQLIRQFESKSEMPTAVPNLKNALQGVLKEMAIANNGRQIPS